MVGLGICTPYMARQALEIDPTVAALLPCGAVVVKTMVGSSVGFLDPCGSSLRWQHCNGYGVPFGYG